MADKQPQSSAANYDPSIPPAEQTRHSPHRGTRCCCCLFSIFWYLLVSIIVFVCLVILVFWIIIQPRSFKLYVTEAKLTQFNYTDNTLRYNLVLNFTARNPNKKLSIYYDDVEGNAFYEGTRFARTEVKPPWHSYRQYKKSTDPMSGVFSGQQVMVLDHDQVSEFDEDERAGAFDIDVKLYFRIRFRLGNIQSGDYSPKAKCELKIPLSSNGTTVAAFEPTKCDVDF